ncbi:MAG: InlB B-repeat-containing protein [Clostridia bacterium]|nr:InlB B-repeat-containing protein [Clostridia bacterium]
MWNHRKYACIWLLLVCTALLFGCGTGEQPSLPEIEYCNVTYSFAMPSEAGPREYTEKVVRGKYALAWSLPGDEQYELEGWYCNGTKYDFYETPITEDIRLEANWIRREYLVKYRIGDYVRAQSAVYYGDRAGDAYQDVPHRFTETDEWKEMLEQGYVFAGWMLDGELWDFENDVVTEDITLDAYFVLADKTE